MIRALLYVLMLLTASCRLADLTSGHRDAPGDSASPEPVPGETAPEITPLETGARVVDLNSLAENHLYPGTRSPLRPAKLRALPPGSITARGALLEKLKDMAGSLGMPDHDDPATLVRIAHVIGDPALLAAAAARVEKIVRGQGSDGRLGARGSRDRKFPAFALQALRDSYEANPTPTTLATMRRYFRFQWFAKESLNATDTIDSHLPHLLWLYNQIGQRWLVDLALRMFDSIEISAELGNENLVNSLSRLRKDDKLEGDTFLSAAVRAWRLARAQQKIPMEMADFELVNGMVAAQSGSFGAHPIKSDYRHNFSSLGIFAPPGLVISNYVARLWLAGPGDGLVAFDYAPCIVKALVGEDEGTAVTLEVTCTWSADDSQRHVVIDIQSPRKTSFPIALHVSEHYDSASARVNAGAKITATPGSYLTLERVWRPGDRLELVLSSRRNG